MAEQAIMDERSGGRARLPILWRSAFGVGLIGAAAVVAWCWMANHTDWVMWVIALGVGAISYNIAFYVLASLYARDLADYHVSDDTRVEAGDVLMETAHVGSSDETLNFYIRAYFAARGATMAALSAAFFITAALLIFG